MPETINDYIDSINNSIDELYKNKKEITPDDLPSDFKLMMGNSAGNSKILQFIFDTKLDHIIDNLLNKMLNGDFTDLDKYIKQVSGIFEMLGIGKDAFTGPVSQALMQNIMNSLNSIKMNTTNNKIKKIMLILKNLKNQSKNIENPEIKKKYIEAVKSFKQVLRFIAKVYKNRRIITNKVKLGLHYAIHEDTNLVNIPQDDEELEFDF